MYRHLENKMCKELEALEEKYRTGMELTEGDLRRMDLLFHSLKSLATYKAMREADEMARGNSYMNGNSYINGNSYTNGLMRTRDTDRYISRDMPDHMYPMYPEERRW